MNPDRFFGAIALSAFFAVFAYGCGRLIGALLVGMMRKKADTAGLQAIIDRRSELERRFAARVGDLRKTMVEHDRKFKQLVQRRLQADQAKAEFAASPDRPLRSLGNEVKGAQLYLALVVNKYAKAGSKSTVDPDWATAQEMEVWAKSLVEARGELDRRSPESQGFKITSLVEPSRA